MRWYGERTLFAFGRLRNNKEASFHFFYTCNLSLKTEFLRNNGQFDEEFKSAAFEDIELGYRLSKRGLQLFYNASAIGYHYQFFSFEDACRKNMGSAVGNEIFFRKEAGQYLLRESQTSQPQAGHALAKRLAVAVARVFSPARRLLDSGLPLPSIVYQLFFLASTTRPPRVRANGPETASGR
jgi:GT2 family glycosyltransferase